MIIRAKRSVRLLRLAGTARLLAASKPRGVPTFTAVAYAGGPMRPSSSSLRDRPIVLDLAGISPRKETLPILRDHRDDRHVGHSTRFASDGRKLVVEGVISGAGPDAKEIVESARRGFTWNVSIAAEIGRVERVEEGQRVHVNGRTIVGPLYLARRSQVFEVSFLTIAADAEAEAKIAARKATMKRNKRNNRVAGDDDSADLLDRRAVVMTAEDADDEPTEADLKEAERRRKIRAACSPEGLVSDCVGAAVQEIQERALAENWSVNDTELAVLRASRPKATAPAFRQAGPELRSVLEAGMCLSLGLRDDFLRDRAGVDERVIDQATARQYRGLSIHGLFQHAIAAVGRSAVGVNAVELFDRALDAHHTLRASGVSTISIPGILSNVANKVALQSFLAIEQTFQLVAATRPVRDFKQVTSYRLTANSTYAELPPGGMIEHGTLSEDSFTNQAKTYGKMFGLDRRDIVNDDLGALMAVPKLLGRGGALKLNTVFWTEFLDNATFFTDARNNYFEGAGTVLSSDSLKTALQKFRDQVNEEGDPLGAEPRVLLLPSSLEIKGLELLRATQINTGGASTETRVPNVNLWADRFTPAVSSYLNSASITGNSSTAWYLIADPNDVAVIEICYLNGLQTPTIESSDADFNQLGLQSRGYFDFGVAKQDYRGGVKSKGAA
jgi:hypothetical protein